MHQAAPDAPRDRVPSDGHREHLGRREVVVARRVAEGLEDLAPRAHEPRRGDDAGHEPVAQEELAVQPADVGDAGRESDGAAVGHRDEHETLGRGHDATVEAAEEAGSQRREEALADPGDVELGDGGGVGGDGRADEHVGVAHTGSGRDPRSAS